MRIHFNIGSNHGHREAIIERAVAALSAAIPGRLTLSDMIETDPWGFSSANKFLNIGVMIETESSCDPLSLIELTRSIERSIDPSPHRDPSGNYIDRGIDIDIIAVDRLVIDTPALTLPHPRARLRDFVMIPLRALDPAAAEWIMNILPPTDMNNS